MAKHHIEAIVNGDLVEFLCETEETLLDVLRDTLNLTGTKVGCDTSQCGSCTVLLDGVAATPVLVLPADPVDLGDEILDVLVDQALHVVAFKEAGPRWRSTQLTRRVSFTAT